MIYNNSDIKKIYHETFMTDFNLSYLVTDL